MQNPRNQYHTIINYIPQITIYSSETYPIQIETIMNAIIKMITAKNSTIINIMKNNNQDQNDSNQNIRKNHIQKNNQRKTTSTT